MLSRMLVCVSSLVLFSLVHFSSAFIHVEYFLSIFYWLCNYSCPNFPLLLPCAWYPPLPSSSLLPYLLMHYPWVVHIGSLSFPFPILFLTPPWLFCTYQLRFLISAPFSLGSPFLLPANNSPNYLHIYDSVPVLVICLVWCFLFLFLFFF